MKSKLLLLSALVGLSGLAHAAIDLDGGIKLIPTATAGVQFNDNLFLSQNNEVNETVWVLAPGATLTSGEGAMNSMSFSYTEQFQVYSDNSNLNTSLSFVDLTSRYDDGKMKVGVDAWFHQANQATRDVRNASRLINRDLLHGAFSDELKWSDKSSARAAVVYDSTSYKASGYRDASYFEVPFQYFYQVQPKLDLSAGLRYRKNTIDGAGSLGSDEYFYSVGARGELTPKVTGEISLGYIQFNPDSGKNQSSLGLQSQFNMELTQKSAVKFGASNQYGYGALGDSYRTTTLYSGVDLQLTANLQLNGMVSYNQYSYSVGSRKDDFWSGLLSATYTVTREFSVNGTLSHANNDSNLNLASFKNNILAVSASYRF